MMIYMMVFIHVLRLKHDDLHDGFSIGRTNDETSDWWFGCHEFGIFPYDLGISSSQLTNSYFSEGFIPFNRTWCAFLFGRT